MKSFTIPKGQRQYYFVIFLGILLVIIVMMIVIISFQQGNQPPSTVQTITPSPKETQPLTQPTSIPFSKPPVTYNREASIKILAKEEQRIDLSPSDAQAKEHILQLLPSGQDYGTVYSSNTIIIDYTQSLDLFKVEILTVDVASAKTEAENWFKNQGMSQEGICNLPLSFYLNWDTANILKNTKFVFNPLPDGC